MDVRTAKTGTLARHILAVYYRANRAEIGEGMEWYRLAHGVARDMAAEHGVALRMACDVIAILSPSMAWGDNVDAADRMLAGWRMDPDMDPRTLGLAAYGPNVDKAWAHLNGTLGREPFGYRAPKTGAFADLIYLAGDSDAVCVDGHAYSIALGVRRTLEQVPGLAGRRYRAVAAGYVEAARIAGVSPCQMQAVTWLVWRREHLAGTRYDRMLESPWD